MSLDLALRPLAGRPGQPVVVVGPSLGTTVEDIWGPSVDALADRADVFGWDLPGHGLAPAVTHPFTLEDVATAVTEGAAACADGRRWVHAGVSVSGVVGLLLAGGSAGPGAVLASASAARIGTPQDWVERAALVRAGGTAALTGLAQRWFSGDFAEAHPARVRSLTAALAEVDDESYALACEALSRADATSSLAAATAPIVLAPGGRDRVVSLDDARRTARAAPSGRVELLPGCGHLPPVEEPTATAALVADLLAAPTGDSSQGRAIRGDVLGADHLAAAEAASTCYSAPFADLITRAAWGTVWARPVLARRDRSIATLTALVAGGHWDELVLHLRAARRLGLTRPEIAEVLLQSAIYCGVPAANHAFALAAPILAEDQP